MDLEIKVKADALRREFQAMGERLKGDSLRKAVAKGTAVIQADAKERAPADTGLLRASITRRVISRGSEIVGQIGTNVHYAIHVEYGHRTTLGKSISSGGAKGVRKKGTKKKPKSVYAEIGYVPGRYFLRNALRIKGDTAVAIIAKELILH